MRLHRALTLALLLPQAIFSVHAQDAPPAKYRAGEIWALFSFSAGTRSAVCASCDEIRSGFGVEAGLGFTPSEHLRIGGTTFLFLDGNGMWDRRDGPEGRKIRHAILQVTVAYYPWDHLPFFGAAGIGVASYGAYNRYSPAPLDATGHPLDSRVYGTGMGLTLTAGWETPLSPSIDLVPALNFLYGSLPELTLNERTLLRSNATLGVLSASLGVRFHGSL
jgi:hypothetical protein